MKSNHTQRLPSCIFNFSAEDLNIMQCFHSYTLLDDFSPKIWGYCCLEVNDIRAGRNRKFMMMIALKKGWGFIQLVCVAAADVCMPAGAPGLNFLFLKTGRLSCVITIGKKHTISTSLKSCASEFFY